MTVFPIFRASPRSGPSTPAAKAREEQKFYEDHCGPDFVGWVREATAVLSAVMVGGPRARADNCDLRTCGSTAAPRAY